MFRFAKPNSVDVGQAVEECSSVSLKANLLASRQGLMLPKLPDGFAHDLSRSKVGMGRQVFETVRAAFEDWKQFDLGWVRVANPEARIRVGEIVAVEVHAFGLWSLNLSQIVDVTQDANAFGFIYKTTAHHAEEGEERFLLTFDSATGDIHYELEAVSKPQHWLPLLAYPATRAFQHRFARESHLLMCNAASAVPCR